MRTKVEMIKRMYPVGTLIELDYMDDKQAVPSGTKGQVLHIDDMGTLHMVWENGSGLGLIYGVDKFHKITKTD